jgi:hypothetical protein
MFHRRLTSRRLRTLTVSFHLLLAGLLAVGGCHHPQTRGQSEDDEREKAEAKYEVRTIGDVTTVGNADPLAVGGVGLVVGLEGTGGDSPPSGYRSMLENELKKEGVPNVREVLASRETALVLVTAKIPAGARRGDPLDVEVTLPPGSEATSLRGGYLRKCYLFNYDFTKNLVPTSAGGNRPVLGHPVAVAEGPLLVGFGDGDEAARLRQARIWGGARCRVDRPFYLVLNSDKQYASVAGAVADRINQSFHSSAAGGPGQELASAKNNLYVVLHVPPQYRHNLPRYLRVVRLVPLREPTAAGADRLTYRQRLEKDLLDPDRCVTAALRLEALGSDLVPALKEGLQSPHPLVRFCAAESLAYLGNPAAGEVLASMVENQPALRAFSLTALASLDEAVSHIKLRELLAARDAETRYGAFRALRALDERDEAVKGELLNESFWLHKVAARSAPLVHVSSSRRAEVVLFGDEQQLKPPFVFQAGEFAVSAGDNDQRCTVVRVFLPAGAGEPRKLIQQCSLRLEDVLRTLARLGGTYPEVVEMLRQAENCNCMSCRVVSDALPQATSVHELARAGSEWKKREWNPGDAADADALALLKQDEEIVKSRLDLGVTPNLFERDPVNRSRAVSEREEEAALRDRRPAAPPSPPRRLPPR